MNQGYTLLKKLVAEGTGTAFLFGCGGWFRHHGGEAFRR